MTSPSRTALLAALVALPLAGAPAGAQAAAPAPPSAAVLSVEAVLPPEVVDDLAALQERALERALVAPGAGAVVSVAVETEDGGLRVEAVDVARGEAPGVARLLDGLPSVDVAAVAGTVRLLDGGATVRTAAAPDPLRGRQWPLSVLRVDELRPYVGATSVVAVLDTGVDGTHPDLDDALVPGVDLVDRSRTTATDPQGHGTHVAGTIAAEVGNGVGVEGLVAGARVMPVRVVPASGSGSTAVIAEGLVAAVDRGASVVNLSLGGPTPDPVMERAVRYANDHGVLVVAAMGNAGAGAPASYPAAYPGVLAVTATNAADERAGFSSTGVHADVAAPGASVVSTYPGGTYATMSGTSMASPHVAAVAAAVRGVAPGLTPEQVTDVLRGTALDLGAAGHDDQYGWGRVQPVEAVRRAAAADAPGALVPATRPAAPASVTAAAGDGRATVSWTPPPVVDGAAEVTGYQVRVRVRGKADQVLPAGRDVRSAELTGLVNGTTYQVDVRATSEVGTGEPRATAVRPVAPATAPRSLRVVAGDARASVQWAPPTSTGAGALTGYEVVVSAPGRADVVVRPGASTRTAVVTGLVNGVDHTVRVRALTATGAGPGATATLRPRTTASAPTRVGVAAGATTDRTTGISVSWAAPSADGGSAVTGYRLLVRADGARHDTVRTVGATTSGGATQSVLVTGLKRDVRYTVAVQAVTAAGPGAASTRSAAVVAR